MQLLSHSEERREGEIPMELEKTPCVREGQKRRFQTKFKNSSSFFLGIENSFRKQYTPIDGCCLPIKGECLKVKNQS